MVDWVPPLKNKFQADEAYVYTWREIPSFYLETVIHVFMIIKLAAIWYTHFTQGLHTTLPYVLSVYMIRMFLAEGLPEDSDNNGISEEVVGFRTGVLGATFCFAQALTSFWLGRLSDTIGRKIIIIMGNVSCAVGVLLFGFSGNFIQACVVRLAMGSTNGIIGAEKALIGDMLTREEQSEAMGYISMTWGIGTLVGPMIGGFLSNPCAQGYFRGDSGVCAPGGLFERKPFLLPCMVASAISVVAIILTVWFLEEEKRTDPNGPTYDAVAVEDTDDERPMARMGVSASLYKKNSDLYRYDSEIHEKEIEMGSLENGSQWTVDSQDSEGLANVQDQRPWYTQKNILLALSGYALIAFCYIILDELVPIFASADIADGGLAYTTSKLSGPLSFSGIVLIVWMVVGYPWMSKKFGITRTCIIGVLQTIPLTFLFPLSSLRFLNTDVIFWIGMGLKSIAGSNAFTSCLVLVNLAAPKESLGEVNGLGQTLASSVRALGPFLGGVMWAGSIRLFSFLGGEQKVWGHQFLPFLLSTTVAGFCIPIYMKLHIPDIH